MTEMSRCPECKIGRDYFSPCDAHAFDSPFAGDREGKRMSPATTLTDFLLARIADDEAVARAFVDEGPWQKWALNDTSGPQRDEEYAQLTIGAARVLVECRAKRRIVELHTFRPPPQEGNDCWECAQPGPCPTLRHLALPYVGHPDYREEWKP